MLSPIRLLPFEEHHFDLLMSWITSREAHVFWTGPLVPYPLTHAVLKETLDESRAQLPVRHCWMAEDSDGQLIGHLELVLDWENQVGRLARVIVAPDHRGKGYASHMVKQVLEHAFVRDGLKRVELNVYPQNSAAVKTYRRLGFREEGIRRSSAQVGNQRWDTMIMGLLTHEWEKEPLTKDA
ncbi:Acetyltransferase [Halomonadaceae bacterium LMG 33818]|uniref:GNAT family N-acetyltransferase n=1 Tax=Cernens ardua TaxID=3402176 RepID=UPI003EDC51FC